MRHKTLGQRIRELRGEKDISLREFARKLDEISPAHVSDIELGRRFPSDTLLKRIASVLGVPVSELAEYDTRPPVEEMKRFSDLNPTFGLALRKLMAKDISAEDIMKLAKRKPDRGKDK